MQRETVLESLEAGVLLVTLNRPAQRNAFNRRMWLELRNALAARSIATRFAWWS